MSPEYKLLGNDNSSCRVNPQKNVHDSHAIYGDDRGESYSATLILTIQSLIEDHFQPSSSHRCQRDEAGISLHPSLLLLKFKLELEVKSQSSLLFGMAMPPIAGHCCWQQAHP